MPDFSEVVQELAGAGYTEAEAIQAAAALAKIPQIDNLIKNPVVTDFIVGTLLDGFDPISEQQKVMVEGIATFSKREKECYFKHTVEGMSFSTIGEGLNISKSSVQQYVERARRKLEDQVAVHG